MGRVGQIFLTGIMGVFITMAILYAAIRINAFVSDRLTEKKEPADG